MLPLLESFRQKSIAGCVVRLLPINAVSAILVALAMVWMLYADSRRCQGRSRRSWQNTIAMNATWYYVVLEMQGDMRMTSFRDGVDRQMSQGKKGSGLSSDIEKSDSRSRSSGHTVGDRPSLYSDLAAWFHLLTAPHDYREEAEFYSALMVEAAIEPVQTVLELGSGGGNNASHMKERFTMTLTDFSPEML